MSKLREGSEKMNSSDERKEIIKSLTNFLPKVAVSLNNLVNYLQNVMDNNETPNPEDFKSIMKDVELVIDAIASMIQKVPLKKESSVNNKDILEKYRSSLKTILKGLKTLLDWMQDEDSDDDELKLKSAIDYLFIGSQGIMQLVQLLTDEIK